jgi:hypothetical protein
MALTPTGDRDERGLQRDRQLREHGRCRGASCTDSGHVYAHGDRQPHGPDDYFRQCLRRATNRGAERDRHGGGNGEPDTRHRGFWFGAVGDYFCLAASEAGNASGTAIPVTGVTVTSPFTIASNTCATLAAGTDCQVMVEFAPTQSGAVAGTLTFTDGAGTQTVALTGTGAAAATDILNPLSLTFSATAVGQLSGSQITTLTNTGGVLLTSISVTVSGPFQTTNNCGAQLAGPGSCAISVLYAPTQLGSQTGTLTVSDALRTQTVALSGTGTLAAADRREPAEPELCRAAGRGGQRAVDADGDQHGRGADGQCGLPGDRAGRWQFCDRRHDLWGNAGQREQLQRAGDLYSSHGGRQCGHTDRFLFDTGRDARDCFADRHRAGLVRAERRSCAIDVWDDQRGAIERSANGDREQHDQRNCEPAGLR